MLQKPCDGNFARMIRDELVEICVEKQRCERNGSFHILKRISFPDYPHKGSKTKYHPSRIHGNGTVCLPTFKLDLKPFA